MNTIRRVDAHQHFWRYQTRDYGWMNDRMGVLKQDFLPADLEPHLDVHGIEGSLAVQARASEEENQFLMDLAVSNPRVLGVVGWLDLRARDAGAKLDILAEQKVMKGIRHLVQDEADPSAFLEDAAFNAGVDQVLEHDMVYEVLIHAKDLSAATAFCARHEGRLVLDHIAKPNVQHDGFASWQKHMAALAKLPHVSCKLSGLVTEAAWGAWTPEALRPYFVEALELFGSQRVLFGSDWPVCLLSGSYDQVVDLLESTTGTLSASERADLWGMNACRIYML